VLVSSSAIAIDLFGPLRRGKATQKQSMLMMRVLCGVFVLLSLWIARSKVDVIVNLMVVAWGTLAGAFLAPYLYGLFWRRTTKAGATAGMISGLVLSVTLLYLWGKANIPVAGAVAMVVPLIVVPVVSLMTRPLPQTLVQKAFGDNERVQKPLAEKTAA
jgi:SSS family solute:Na+ symporter